MAVATESSRGANVLTFTLRTETFAVPVAQVREILDNVPLTRVPQLPDFVSGVINLRGRVVPVIDLRLRFGFAPREASRETCIIVLEIVIDGALAEVGALVDGVQEVLTLEASEIDPPPRLGLGMSSDLLAGLGKRGGGFIILLRPERLISAGESLLLTGLEVATATTEEG